MALALPAQPGTTQAPAQLVLRGGMVLTPDGEAFVAKDVVLGKGRIVAITEPGALVAGPPRSIQVRGKFLIPGMIDLHSHLLLQPYDQRSWNDQVLKDSLGLRTIRATVAARHTLEAGFTTLRELGTEGAGFADVALRDAIAEGTIPGPRIFAATRALVATGCYGPSGFAPEHDLPKGAQVCDGVDGVRKATRQQIAAGADWIKIYADYRRQPGGPSTPTFSPEELRAIVAEARRANIPGAAHAVTDRAIRAAVEAGVDTIEHGYFLGAEAAKAMKARGVVLCPTLSASEAMARYQGWRPGEPEPLRIKAARGMFARALKYGVTIACGSDVGVFAHGDNAREIELMAEYGMGAKRALQAATVVAARVLRRDHEIGRLQVGMFGDVVVLDENPHANIGTLRSPRLVVKGGAVAARRRER